jgi:hypothetical protein
MDWGLGCKVLKLLRGSGRREKKLIIVHLRPLSRAYVSSCLQTCDEIGRQNLIVLSIACDGK